MEDLKNYYKSEKISIDFDAKREGYWISIAGLFHFVDRDSYRYMTNLVGSKLLSVLETYNQMIPYNLTQNQISLHSLEDAFSAVKKIEEKEFEEFKKSKKSKSL